MWCVRKIQVSRVPESPEGVCNSGGKELGAKLEPDQKKTGSPRASRQQGRETPGSCSLCCLDAYLEELQSVLARY